MYDDNGKMVELVLDKSGSMSGWKLNKAKDIFLEELENRLSEDDHAGVITFDTGVKEVNPIAKFTTRNREKMRENVNKIAASGNTALYDALGDSIDRLVDEANGSDRELIVLGLTDGMENSSSKFYSPENVKRYANSKGVDLKIILIGLGNRIDEEALETIAKGTGGEYISAPSTPQGLGEAAGKAGDVIGGKTAGRNRKGRSSRKDRDSDREGKSRDWSKKREKGKRSGEEKHSWIKFEGNISRNEMEYMEKIAERSVEKINERYEMKGGSVTVPVYLLEKERFEKIFGKRTEPSRYCWKLYKHLPIEEVHKPESTVRPEDQGLPPGTAVGAGARVCCRGKLMGVFLNDMIFHRFEEKLKRQDVSEVTPGIYIKDVKERGRNGMANIKYVMSHLAVSSAIYYSTSRRAVVKRRKLSAVHSLICGTLSLLSNRDKKLEEFEEHCTLIGPGALPIQLAKHVGKADTRENLCKFYEELPVQDLLNGYITENNEETYIEGVEDLLEKLVNRRP